MKTAMMAGLLGVGAIALAGGGFFAGRMTAPVPEGWIDISSASEGTQKLLTMPGALDFLGQVIHVENGGIKIFNPMDDGRGLSMPDGYPAWPGPLRLLEPRGGTTWIDATLTGGEALAASKDKWTIVNLWASWCAPCIAEMPDLDALAGQLDPAKVSLVLLNADTQHKDTPESVAAMLAAKGLSNVTSLVAEGDAIDIVLKQAGLDTAAYPTTLIFAPGGRPFGYVHGAADGVSGWGEPGMITFFQQLGALPAPPG